MAGAGGVPVQPFAVTIFTHEAGSPPMDGTIVQLLTDFFGCVRVRLHTLVLAGDLENWSDTRNAAHAHLTLVDSAVHKKECVQTTQEFTEQQSEVMYLQCHGIERNLARQRPCAGLTFRCGRNAAAEIKDAQTVWTRPPFDMHEAVCLHEVVKGCRLAIALACCGKQLKEDYLMAVRWKTKFPDMLLCNADEMDSSTVEIFAVLLINILDSNIQSYNLGKDEVYREVRAAIIRIFQIVQLFNGQPMEFWGFLERVGCISDLRLQKQRQQLEYPRRMDRAARFRTTASVYSYWVADNPHIVFDQFQALQLVCKCDVGAVVEIDWTTVPPIQTADGPDEMIDKYLREYQQRKAAAGVEGVPGLALLLARLEVFVE